MQGDTLEPGSGWTLGALLEHMNDLDAAAEPLPPEAFAIAAEELAGKVDRIKTVVERLTQEEARLRENAADLLRAAQAVKNNCQSLKERVAWTMEQANFQKLPGEKWRLDLMNNAPSVEVDREATALEAEAYPEFVAVEKSYKWNREALKEALQQEDAPSSFSFARLKFGKHIRFFVRKST